jgi:hypothetical protein
VSSGSPPATWSFSSGSDEDSNSDKEVDELQITIDTSTDIPPTSPRTNLSHAYGDFKRASTAADCLVARKRVVEARERVKTLEFQCPNYNCGETIATQRQQVEQLQADAAQAELQQKKLQAEISGLSRYRSVHRSQSVCLQCAHKCSTKPGNRKADDAKPVHETLVLMAEAVGNYCHYYWHYCCWHYCLHYHC